MHPTRPPAPGDRPPPATGPRPAPEYRQGSPTNGDPTPPLGARQVPPYQPNPQPNPQPNTQPSPQWGTGQIPPVDPSRPPTGQPRQVPPGSPPPPGGGQPPASPPPPANRRLMIIIGSAVALVAVIGIVLVIVLTHAPSQRVTTNKPTGPAISSGGGEVHGRRPITSVLPSTGRTLTVAKDGSGQFSSIQQAADQAQPGDTVLISAGEYDEPLDVPRDGAQNAYITFHAAPGANVVISGTTDKDGLVYLKGRQWIRFVGITVANSSRHGIYAVDSQHIVVQDSGVSTSQDGGMVFINGGDIQVVHSEVQDSNAEGTDASNEAMTFSGINGFEAAFNVVTGCGEEGIDAKYDTTNGKIHDNTSDRNRGPNIYVDGASNIEIYNNTITGATGDNKAGLSLGIEDAAESKATANITIYNNVISGNTGGGISFFVESDGTFSDLKIVNNTIVSNGDGDGINPHDYTFAGTNVLRNNIFSGNKRDAAGKTDPFTADHNLFSNGGIGSANVTGAASFVDAAKADLHLAPGSPGIGAGSPDGAPQSDITGAPRPAGKIDIGAYQSTG